MVDAQPGIASIGIPKELPEGVDAFAGVKRAQGVDSTLCGKLTEGVAHLRPEQRIIDPSLRRIDIEPGRHDVVVAREHDRLLQREQGGRMRNQPLEPVQLVAEFGSGRRVTVRQIQTAESMPPAAASM